MCEMHFTYLKCKIQLPEWICLKTNLVLAMVELCEVDRFSYWSSCISPEGRVYNEVSSRIRNSLSGFP